MIVVSDTSALTNLAAVGQLALLQRLYDRVLIPEAVRAEWAADPEFGTGAVVSRGWLEVVPISNQALLASLRKELDVGEAEAVVLALEVKADLLLMDERRGRRAANTHGIRVVGLLGVLLEAKQKHFIPQIKPVLDDLVHRAGFWVSEKLREETLLLAGE